MTRVIHVWKVQHERDNNGGLWAVDLKGGWVHKRLWAVRKHQSQTPPLQREKW